MLVSVYCFKSRGKWIFTANVHKKFQKWSYATIYRSSGSLPSRQVQMSDVAIYLH